MTRPGPAELVLVGEAVQALGRAGATGRVAAATAVRTVDGQVVVALALPGVCSEAAALAVVLAQGRRPATLVTVRRADGGTTRVAAPCAAGLRLLREHAPELRVLHLGDGLRVSPVAALATSPPPRASSPPSDR